MLFLEGPVIGRCVQELLETGDGGGFCGTGFKDGEQARGFQGALQVRAEITELEAAAFGFRLSMHFEESAEAGAVHIIDVFEINDNACGAGGEEIVEHGEQADVLLSEDKTPFERQKVDSV